MMKKLILLTLMFSSVINYAQEEKENYSEDIFGLKVGLIGVWINYEQSLSTNMTLNTEIGYEGGFLKGTNNKFDYIFTTIFSLEPRYYYNFHRRQEKNKKINNNSANYIGAEMFFVPNLLSSTNRNNVSVNKSFGFIPKYGLRRNISDNLSLEFAFGIGYVWGENRINGLTSAFDFRINMKL